MSRRTGPAWVTGTPLTASLASAGTWTYRRIGLLSGGWAGRATGRAASRAAASQGSRRTGDLPMGAVVSGSIGRRGRARVAAAGRPAGGIEVAGRKTGATGEVYTPASRER